MQVDGAISGWQAVTRASALPVLFAVLSHLFTTRRAVDEVKCRLILSVSLALFTLIFLFLYWPCEISQLISAAKPILRGPECVHRLP